MAEKSEKLPGQVTEFIKGNKVAHFATISADQKRPQIATIYFVFYDQAIYFATRRDSVKIKNIKANSNIAMVITDSRSLITLQLEGIAEIENDIDLKASIVELYNKVSNESGPNAFPPLMKTEGFSIDVVKCNIGWFRFSDFSGSKQIMIENNL